MATTTLPYTPPLQELPPWLSYSTFTTTIGQTAVVTQTVVNLPLTYYGPPIPLGTDGVWVYGGLTSPPPTPTATSSSSASAPTSSSASITASSSTPSSSTTSSSAASSTPATGSHDHSGFPVWAILVIAIVCGLAVGIGLLLAFALWYRRRHPSGSTSSSSHYPDDDEVEQGGTRFRILRALPIPRSLRSSQHRHSRVPQHDEETAQVTVIHPNDSDWQLIGQSREQLAAIRNVRPPPPDGRTAAYGPILPFEDRTPPHTPPPSQPSSTASSQPGTALPRPDTMGGNSFSDMSNHSLFFNPALQAGETFDRDRRVFPDHYALGIEQSPQFQPLNPPPRPRTLPPVDQDLVLPPPLIGGARRSGEGRRSGDRARSQGAPLMAYPDSPVSDADEAAALLAARRRSASPPTRTSTPPVTDNNRLISRLSTLIKRLSGSSQAATTTPFMLHPSTPTTSGPSMSQQQMKETGAGLGFGFLAAPPVSMSTRRTGATSSDRPISTISGATVYHDAHSRPQSPYHDAPPTYQPSHTPTPERAYADAPLPEEADILDEQPPRPLRYPPGLTPPQAAYQQRRGSAAGVGETGLLEELEEEDIVGELPPHPLDDLEDDAPEAGQEFAALSSSSKGKQREKRGTLGAPMPFAGTQTPSAKSPTSSHFPHRSASRSTGGHSGSGSGTSSSRRSRRTGGSSVSSSSLRRLQQSSGSGDAYLVPPDEMPTAGKGKRRGGNPLLSATFGPPATWLRSRSPSAGSAPPTPRSGRSVKSHSHSKSKSRSGSQPHSQEPSRGPSPVPPQPELRTVASFAESAFSMQQSMTTAVTTEPSASVRYVPSRQPVRADDKAELTVEEEERLPLTSA